jgi:hypothetical protein
MPAIAAWRRSRDAAGTVTLARPRADVNFLSFRAAVLQKEPSEDVERFLGRHGLVGVEID